MILSELTGYLAQHRRVALIDMAYRFGASPDALRGMLAILERKGWVRRLEGGAACGSACGKCDTSALETYEWLGSPAGVVGDAHP